MTALTIASNTIKYEEVTEDLLELIKTKLIENLPKFLEISQNDSVFAKSCEIIALITIMQDSDKWNQLFDLVFSSSPPIFLLFVEFVEDISMNELKIDRAEVEKFDHSP